MWGVDKDNTVWYKEMTNPDLQMQRMANYHYFNMCIMFLQCFNAYIFAYLTL